MKKVQVKIEPLGVTCLVDKGTPLTDILRPFNVEFPCGGNGRCGNCKVKKLSGEVDMKSSLQKGLGMTQLPDGWILACLCKVNSDLVIELPQNNMQIQTDDSDFTFVPESGYGIAVDLGSTTIVLQLVDLTTGKIVRAETGINPQTAYGADIISRISFALQGSSQAQILRDCIRSFLNDKIQQLITSIDKDNLRKVTIVGNTVMHHLFAGYDVKPLAKAPFTSPHNQSITYTPKDLNWGLNDMCTIKFLPNISHFVGSDILSGISATHLDRTSKYSLLIDLGTNGEMALGNSNEIIYTSTAAGPAFEGINISCGMRATSGAAHAIDCIDHQFHLHTIDNTEAKGLCGSGLIEAICCLLQEEKIDFTGAVTDETCHEIQLSDQVSLTIEDIREFQLAKAALAAGIEILLGYKQLRYEDIDRVYLTGGLGNYLNLEKAQSVGLFTGFNEHQIQRIPNAALKGCRQYLFDSYQTQIPEILEKCRFCSLENNPQFQDIYCEQMFFPLPE